MLSRTCHALPDPRSLIVRPTNQPAIYRVHRERVQIPRVSHERILELSLGIPDAYRPVTDAFVLVSYCVRLSASLCISLVFSQYPIVSDSQRLSLTVPQSHFVSTS